MMYINYCHEYKQDNGLKARCCYQCLMEGSLSNEQIAEVSAKLADRFCPKKLGLPAIGENKTRLQWLECEPEENREYLTRECELDFLPMTAEEFYAKVMAS